MDEPEKAEHFCVSLVEAMSARAILSALNSGGPREVIAHGGTGFLCQSVDDLKAMTVKILSESGPPRQLIYYYLPGDLERHGGLHRALQPCPL